MARPEDTIGFIGLGIMGSNMIRNLLDAGFTVHIWNRTPEKIPPLVDAGGVAGSSPADVATHSQIVIVCVSDTADAESVILGDSGVLAGAQAGDLVIDMSTISPSVTRTIAKRLANEGVHMLDAPISGGSEGAEKGTLSIMVGGEVDQVERALPVFRAMGKTITHVGPSGAGQTVKLVNQIVVVINMLAVSEGLLFAEAAGVDLHKTLDAISEGAAGSWMLKNRGPQVLARDWRPGFMVDLQQKDIRLALEAGDELGVSLLATSMVFQLYRTLQRAGLGEEGNHALAKALEALSGIRIGERKSATSQE